MPAPTALLFRGSFGDELCTTPLVKGLYAKYQRPVFVNSNFSRQIFRNSPYVSEKEDYSHLVPLHLPDEDAHCVHLVDHFASQAGIDPADRDLDFFLDGNDRFPLDIPEDGTKIITIDTRCGWPIRQWPLNRFLSVCEELKRKKVFVIEIGKEINNCFDQKVSCRLSNANLSFLNKLSLRQTAYVISRSDAFLGSDSGLSHLSAALGIPAITLFGPIHPATRSHRQTIPIFTDSCPKYNEKHLQCDNDHTCMRSITTDLVLSTTLKVLFKPGFADRCTSPH